MARPKDILRSIRDKWPSPDHSCRKRAEELVSAYERPKRHGRGRPSEFGLIFELCTLIGIDLINDTTHAQFREHVEHTPKPKKDIDDGGEFLQSIESCKECEKADLYSSLFRGALIDELNKILKLHRKLKPTMGTEDIPKPKKTGEIPRRTIRRHVKAWLTIMHHPDWLSSGIPIHHHHLFERCQIKDFDAYRETIQSHTQASDAWQLAITIKEFFNNTPLLVP